jgi:hypothetical protein
MALQSLLDTDVDGSSVYMVYTVVKRATESSKLQILTCSLVSRRHDALYEDRRGQW